MVENNHIVVMHVLHSDTTPHAAERLGRTYILVMGPVPHLPDQFHMIVYRGGEEQRPTIHTQLFDDRRELLKDAKEKIRDRFNHGYSLVWNSPDFPLLGWITARHYAVEYDTNYAPPGIQLHLPLTIDVA
jgi:hypothetical protein